MLRSLPWLRGPALFAALCSTTALCGACQIDPEGSDRFVAKHPGFPNRGFWKGLALYFPNRILDLVDIVHAGYGIGPGLGAELHPTRYLRLGGGAGIDAGVAWLGRMGNPFQSGHYARASFSVFDAQEAVEEDLRWRIPRWDVGIFAHFWFQEAYLGLALDEVFDFFTGIITYDLKDDDFGRVSGRETRFVADGGVEEFEPKKPGD